MMMAISTFHDNDDDDDNGDDDDDDDDDDDNIYLAASSDTFLRTLMARNTLPTFRTFLLYHVLS